MREEAGHRSGAPARGAQPPASSRKIERAAVPESADAGVMKRRKLLSITYKKGPTKDAPKQEKTAPPPASAGAVLETRYFLCMYTKRSNKKHKVYEDGVISVEGNIVKLFDMEAKMLGKTNTYTAQNLSDLHSGNELVVGAKVWFEKKKMRKKKKRFES